MALTIFIAAGVHRTGGAVSAQAADPLTLPRLSFTDFTYMGGFRLPNTVQGADFSYGGSHMAYNPARNSLFVNSLRHMVAEVTIPAPVNTSDVSRMSFASYLQPFSDPSEGRLAEIGDGTILSGLLVQGDRLYATGSIYYDADYEQMVSHFSHSTNLSEPSFRGFSQVWETGRTGYVAGYMANVPAQWRALLGGPALTGQCCIPIVSRTSYGPAAFSFDPAGIGSNTALAAAPLLYYMETQATLGPWLGSNEVYGASALMGGLAVIEGTSTALFVGRIGLGDYCYGKGVSDPALHGTIGVDGPNCYDPGNTTKGQHGYPYRYQIWAYDLADFAAVKAGAKQPWEIVPYAVWPFELPTPEVTVQIGGVAYDPQRQLLYISQMFADLDGLNRRPIVHAMKINIPSSTDPPPPSAAVSGVILTTSLPAPQQTGSRIVWNATPIGGSGALLYKWLVYDGVSWAAAGPWSSSNQFTWTPAAANNGYRVSAWVKSATNAADEAESSSERPFPITEAVSTSTPVASVALNANLPAPQLAGSTIAWTAAPTGGTGALLFKWFVHDGAAWKPASAWSSSNQFNWTPPVASDRYRVAVWVKRATNSADAAEASSERPFAITEAATRVVSVALSTDLPAPQRAGSTIVWTATPTGGAGALVYKWFVHDGASWKPAIAWTSSNRFNWTPPAASDRYRVAVWVKRATNTADAAEAASERPFAISASAGASTPVASVALTTDLPAPQQAGSTIVWTATPTGGTGALVYKWFVHDGTSWKPVVAWTASNRFSWTPLVASDRYRVSVWVKRATNTADAAEAAFERPFAITASAFASTPVASVALSTALPAPQLAGSTIVWTATPIGGAGALVYKWFVNDGIWKPVSGWTSSNRFSWTPLVASDRYRVSVWVKRVSNTADAAEASSERPFAITATSTRVVSVGLSTDLPAPQQAGSTIGWTAAPTGGTGALVYKWFVHDGTSWKPVVAWTASNRFSWTPLVASDRYRVSVWVKRATNTADAAEAAFERPFPISAVLDGASR